MRYWGNRMSHKVTWWSDIFLLREYIVNCTSTTSITRNLLHWTPCPPPLRISTWISIIVALVSKCSCGRLSLRKCHRSEATQDIAWTLAGRLQEVRKWWNLLTKFLGVISLIVRYCGEPPRPRCSVLGLRSPGLEFLCRIPDSCVWRAASFHSSYHSQEVSLAQFNQYVLKGGIKPHSIQS